MAAYYDRVKVLTPTVGTGPLTLGAAVAGRRSFAAAGVANRSVVTYLIEDGAAWEIGRGLYDATAGTLTRFQFHSSSTGALLVLTGTAAVSIMGAAADFDAVASAQGMARRSSILTRMPQSTMVGAGIGAGTGVRTYHVMQTLEGHFDAVRVGFVNNLATAQTIAAALASANAPGLHEGPGTGTRDPTANGGAWLSATFNSGQATAVTGAGAYAAPTVTWSDWMGVSSLDRLDGGLPILHLRLRVDPGANAVPVLNGSGSTVAMDYDEQTFGMGRSYRVREYVGDALSNLALMTSDVQSFQHPALIIQYLARKEGHTLYAVGDSITNNGVFRMQSMFTQWPYRLRNALSRPDRPVELCAGGYAAMTMRDYAAWTVLMIAAGISPTLVIASAYSPNIFTQITASEYAKWAAGLGRIFAAARAAGASVMPWGTLPSDPSVKPFGATDALRVAWHNRLEQYPNFVDIRSIIPFTVDGNGQEVPQAGYLQDGLHPTAATYGLMADAMLPTVSRLLA